MVTVSLAYTFSVVVHVINRGKKHSKTDMPEFGIDAKDKIHADFLQQNWMNGKAYKVRSVCENLTCGGE